MTTSDSPMPEQATTDGGDSTDGGSSEENERAAQATRNDPIRVLHVDDDPDLLAVSTAMLEREFDHIEVLQATSVTAAVQLLASHEVDCIVSDYEMPRQNGLEFLQHVRSLDGSVPFVLFTGNEEVVGDALEKGVWDVVTKGVGKTQFAKLANRITRAVAYHEAIRVGTPRREDPVERTAVDPSSSGPELDRLALLLAMNESTVDGRAVVGDDGGVLECNTQFLALLNLHGTRPGDWIDSSGLLEAAAEAVVESTRFRQMAVRLTANPTLEHHDEYELRDGRHVEVYAGPVRGETGVRYGRLWTISDITGRKHREETLRRTGERFEEFAATVSHDLRNPLNVAEGYLELARETNDSEALAEVAMAHDRMRMLIVDLLTLARANETISVQEPLNLRVLVERCWRNVRTEVARLDVETDRIIVGDESRLCQLVENLLRNAVEHGCGDGRTDGSNTCGDDDLLTIQVGDIGDGFYIADDGCGIPAERRDRIFESGFSTTTDGTGFGLKIVEQIAAAHGWTVDVCESASGGARFEFTGVEFA
ncbi:ATP-binding response regulator [Haloarchaeobius baliensis]|uniref:ATP-binding response regulator n=1 Tax=Haloarchaeobius baliensis TaxID=1670458 RepID=UPI003F885514